AKYAYLPKEDKKEIVRAFEQFVMTKKVLPSMRSCQFAGKAILAHESRIYNCSGKHMYSPRCFAEQGFIALLGTGTALGIGKKYVNQLPELIHADQKTGTVFTYAIDDTIEGWANS